jgi:hypothetical protein
MSSSELGAEAGGIASVASVAAGAIVVGVNNVLTRNPDDVRKIAASNTNMAFPLPGAAGRPQHR